MRLRELSYLIIAIILASCSANTKEKDATTATHDAESLAFWTSDIVVERNPRLVALMDTLYRYNRKDFYENNIDINIHWMRNYRKQLCNYYKGTHGVDSISEYSMADSVLQEARRLWNIDKNESTMGMIVSNDVERTRLIFEQFNEYDKLNNVCETEAQREMLKQEFAEWLKLRSFFSKIFANCVDLHYWDGSLGGVIWSAHDLEIWSSHIDLYKKEYLIITKSVESWNDDGTFVDSAKNLLIDCCNQAPTQYYYSDIDNPKYTEKYIETKELLKGLPERVDAWCNARQPWEEEMCTDWLRPEYPHHTSEVLLKLAHIISSVQ